MTAPARVKSESMAAMQAIEWLAGHANGSAIPPCQDPNCDCSAGEARAVRNRSAEPRPARDRAAGAGLSWYGRSPWSAACLLTPARGGAKRLAARLGGASGSGGAVLARTAIEPSQNQQTIDNARFVARFSRFYAVASRDARAGVCAITRAYTRVTIHRTIEPLAIVYVMQWVNGSVTVLWRFSPEPAGLGSGQGRGILRFFDKLGGRYRRALVELEPNRACSTVAGGWRGESFGDFGAGRSSRAGDRARGLVARRWIRARCGNGGILRFSAHPIGHVGRVVLEGPRQDLGFVSISAGLPLPVRLARAQAEGGCLDRPGHPPMPPAPSARPLARWRCELAGFGSACRPARIGPAHMTGQAAPVPTGAKSGGSASGRGGERRGIPGLHNRVGVRCSAGKGWKPRGDRHASGGICHVN